MSIFARHGLTPDDPLGLAHEARAGPGRGLGLDLLLARNEELLAQGITGRPVRDRPTITQVMTMPQQLWRLVVQRERRAGEGQRP